MLNDEFLVAIPVFNEERYVQTVLDEIRRYADHILVVDDGSTDRTPELLDGESGIHRIRHGENRGYGQSLYSAFRFAIDHNYAWLITIDCDEQHEPSCIPAFMEMARSQVADVISGSRYLKHFPGNGLPPLDRRLVNTEITHLLNSLLGLSLTDAFCGFKAYRVDSLERLRITVPGYAMPLQFWVQAARAGMRIKELPVRLIYKDSTRHFGGMLDIPQQRRQHYLDVLISELGDESYFEFLRSLPRSSPTCCRPC